MTGPRVGPKKRRSDTDDYSWNIGKAGYSDRKLRALDSIGAALARFEATGTVEAEQEVERALKRYDRMGRHG